MNRTDLMRFRNNLKYEDEKFNRIMERRERLYKITPTYSEGGNGSRKHNDKFAEELASIVDEEANYLQEVKDNINGLRELEKLVDLIDDPIYKRILQLMYLNDKNYNLTQVSNMIDKNYTYTCTLHGEALNEFDKICEVKGICKEMTKLK